MEERIDVRMVSWVRDVLPGVDVTLQPPSADGTGERGVSLYLWRLRPRPPLGALRNDVLQLALEYLVTTWAPEPEDAHDMLLELAFSALQEPGLEVELEAVEPSVWQAFGVPPKTAFRLSVLSQRIVATRGVKPVLHPLSVTASTMASLSGWVRTPDGIPVAGARVEVPAVERRSRTGADGRFRLDSIPAGDAALRVRVTAKGHEAWTTIGAADDRTGVVIEIEPREVPDAGISHT